MILERERGSERVLERESSLFGHVSLCEGGEVVFFLLLFFLFFVIKIKSDFILFFSDWELI